MGGIVGKFKIWLLKPIDLVKKPLEYVIQISVFFPLVKIKNDTRFKLRFLNRYLDDFCTDNWVKHNKITRLIYWWKTIENECVLNINFFLSVKYTYILLDDSHLLN